MRDYSDSNFLKALNEIISRCQEICPDGYADPNTTNAEWAQYLLDWDELGWAKCYDV